MSGPASHSPALDDPHSVRHDAGDLNGRSVQLESAFRGPTPTDGSVPRPQPLRAHDHDGPGWRACNGVDLEVKVGEGTSPAPLPTTVFSTLTPSPTASGRLPSLQPGRRMEGCTPLDPASRDEHGGADDEPGPDGWRASDTDEFGTLKAPFEAFTTCPPTRESTPSHAYNLAPPVCAKVQVAAPSPRTNTTSRAATGPHAFARTGTVPSSRLRVATPFGTDAHGNHAMFVPAPRNDFT